ncbi:MAG: hypothetical protein WAN47_05845 [Nitrosotalea sp.]
MRLRQDHKIAIAFTQIVVIAIAFFLINGVVALVLYLVSEISLVELIDFISMLGSSDSLAIIGYHIFKRSKEKLWHYLNDSSDSEVVSESKIKELKRLLRE